MRLEEEVILMKVFKWEAAGTKGSEGKLNLSCSLGAINQPVKQHKALSTYPQGNQIPMHPKL